MTDCTAQHRRTALLCSSAAEASTSQRSEATTGELSSVQRTPRRTAMISAIDTRPQRRTVPCADSPDLCPQRFGLHLLMRSHHSPHSPQHRNEQAQRGRRSHPHLLLPSPPPRHTLHSLRHYPALRCSATPSLCPPRGLTVLDRVSSSPSTLSPQPTLLPVHRSFTVHRCCHSLHRTWPSLSHPPLRSPVLGLLGSVVYGS